MWKEQELNRLHRQQREQQARQQQHSRELVQRNNRRTRPARKAPLALVVRRREVRRDPRATQGTPVISGATG